MFPDSGAPRSCILCLGAHEVLSSSGWSAHARRLQALGLQPVGLLVAISARGPDRELDRVEIPLDTLQVQLEAVQAQGLRPEAVLVAHPPSLRQLAWLETVYAEWGHLPWVLLLTHPPEPAVGENLQQTWLERFHLLVADSRAVEDGLGLSTCDLETLQRAALRLLRHGLAHVLLCGPDLPSITDPASDLVSAYLYGTRTELVLFEMPAPRPPGSAEALADRLLYSCLREGVSEEAVRLALEELYRGANWL
jgi:hypothetical protein|nr:MAG: hypothetical protein KatS3mg041_1903 [Bacteroidota bacterium]